MLPADALDWLRNVFSACDRALAGRLSKSPHTHEPSLDQLFISTLQDYPAYTILPSHTSIWIDTHFLGGRAMFYNWEVADIGMLITFRVKGAFKFSKVVLLQSKRLYPEEVAADDDLVRTYGVGFARLFPSNEYHAERAKGREFSFGEDSKYLAIKQDEQIGVIRQYQRQNRIPVYYLLYNPVRLPWRVRVPLIAPVGLDGNIDFGTRVVRSEVVFRAVEVAGGSPSLAGINESLSADQDDAMGWPLPDFVVDHVLMCREGRIIEPMDGEPLYNLFNRRSGPIAAAISITCDLPDEDSLPREFGDAVPLPRNDE